MVTYVLRVWLPDRPGALGAVASRIGAVRGDVVGIDILERGAGRAIDELIVVLPSAALVGLLVAEVGQVDGVDVEDVRPLEGGHQERRLDALEAAATLAATRCVPEVLMGLCVQGARVVGAEWAAVVDLAEESVAAAIGPAPAGPWLRAFVEGSRFSLPAAGLDHGPDDVLWAALPATDLALVIGRSGLAFRARERREAAALARIAAVRVGDAVEAPAIPR